MATVLKKAAYESLLGQITFLKDNIGAIKNELTQNGVSLESVEGFFSKYISTVQALADEAEIVDNDTLITPDSSINRLPVILLGSYFTLRGPDRSHTYFHLSVENMPDSNLYREVYFLSASGISFLLKELGTSIVTDLGFGKQRYHINSIRFI